MWRQHEQEERLKPHKQKSKNHHDRSLQRSSMILFPHSLLFSDCLLFGFQLKQIVIKRSMSESCTKRLLLRILMLNLPLLLFDRMYLTVRVRVTVAA